MKRITEGLAMLEVTATVMGEAQTIYPVLVWDSGRTVLVDTGFPGQLPLIREEIIQAGIRMEQLSDIVITHQDIDHIGSLSAILDTSSPHQIKVWANAAEKPYIEGERMLLKITPEAVSRAMASLPSEVPEEWRNAFKQTLENPPKGQVNDTLAEGEEVGSLVVIDTPGHTPGHISLYQRHSKTLIAADAMIVSDGRLYGPHPHLCTDYDLAIKSLEKLTSYDIETVICYHGGLYQRNVNQRIAELASRCKSSGD